MQKFALLLLLTVLLISCKEANKPVSFINSSDSATTAALPVKDSVAKPLPVKPKKLGDYMSGDYYSMWSAKQSDSPHYWVRLNFEKEFVSYQFHGQCIYTFFTNYYHTKTDKIELLWTYKTDCISPLDFLKSSHGVKKFPKHGDAFCEYTLVNDSVISVKYNFPEWVKAVNKFEKDSIFPNYLYLNLED
jgi:hypothetical protein